LGCKISVNDLRLQAMNIGHTISNGLSKDRDRGEAQTATLNLNKGDAILPCKPLSRPSRCGCGHVGSLRACSP
jgi:hypothetical protein